MKTIKLPYRADYDIIKLQKQYSSVVRFAYNRYLDGKTQKDIRLLCKSLNNIDLLDSWLIQCAILDAQVLNNRIENKNKVIFGGKINFKSRLQNKISKTQYQLTRLIPINIQGEETKTGNRKFKLDIINNNQIIFKLNRKDHIKLELPKLKSNLKKELFKLQELNDIKQGLKGITYSVKIDHKHIYISFEEFKHENKLNLFENRYIGIDMNPEYIGISICDYQNSNHINIIHIQQFDLTKLTTQIFNLNVSSEDIKFKKLNNKLNFETIEIAKSIQKLALQYKCKYIFIEDFKFKSDTKKQYHKLFNRLTKNIWKRNIFIQNLNKRCSINGIILKEVSPQYSSFIGNIKYSYTDPINASIEIGRRGYEVRILKNKKFYPDFNIDILKDQWKKYFDKELKGWKDFFNLIKNAKLKYRVSLKDCKHIFKVFSLNSHKSKILNYIFYN